LRSGNRELFASVFLRKLAGGGVGQLVDELDASGSHHLATLGADGPNLTAQTSLLPAPDADQQRPRSSIRMGNADRAASWTPGSPTAAFSGSIELIHSPPDLMTVLRPVGDLQRAVGMMARRRRCRTIGRRRSSLGMP
jgi:hypothetical protein